MNFQIRCNRYIEDIRHTRANPDATPELSFFPHLQAFLEDITNCFDISTITFTQEPRRLDQIGRPDFIVRESLFPIGYIEAEAYGRNLDMLTGHAAAQNARFIENLDNFILTNFVEFRLYAEGQQRLTANVEDSSENLEGLLERFLSAGPLQIGTSEALAKHLARRTRELQTQIETTLTDENSQVYGMFSAFRELLLTTLTPDDFADMYAQTLAYGLFAARCTLPNATNFSRETATNALPRSNPFLRQLFYQVASPNLEANVTYILDEIVSLLRNVSTEMLRTAFTVETHLEDPVIHFYETFLASYDPHRRVERGVYYTPPQVISYIVRSVDSLLKTELNRPDGLADDNTLILDPATGTGGFLLEVFDHIREYVITRYGTGDWHRYINAQLVKRLFGFELLVAPYTIAHLKLSLFLQAHGWDATERLRIYLTNTLEEPVERTQRLPFADFISDEANAAVSVKRDEPLLVILGNPPYPENSANPSRNARGELTFIGNLIEDYKQIDDQPLGERNIKSLQADYVKFIRWAQWRIEQNGEGVIGYIVNNSFLDGIIFRGMRRSLQNSFNTIYCLNLHGSGRFTENIPEGETDQNIFDIQQGVSILACVKESNNLTEAKIYYADMWGSREERYHSLSENDIQSTEWTEVHPTLPLYLFVPQNTENRTKYEQGWNVTDIFQERAPGIVSGRDRLAIQRTPDAIRDVVTNFTSFSEAVQADLRNYPNVERHIVPILYRPFDIRWTYYTGQSSGFHERPRHNIMQHLLQENLALCVHRGIRSPTWQHVLVTDQICEKSYISNRSETTAHVFPLYLYPNPEELAVATERSVNLKPVFLRALSEALGLPQTAPSGLPQSVSPEEILGYVYVILYSPTYRERYYEFLKYDFPRIPLPTDIEYFRKLAALGRTLIHWHLLKDGQVPPRHRFEGEGDAVVSKVRYEGGHVWINPTQHFTDVPIEVWEYEIGAYQVCEKWLRDRKNTPLSHAEVRQYCGILVAIAETLRITEAIDEVLDF